MAPRKQTITHNVVSSKGRTNSTVGGHDSRLPSINNIPPRTLAPSHLGGSCQHKGQILQMLTDMKEQMKEQQIRSDRDREHVTIDRKNAFREKEALKHRNDKLHVQIIALQRVQEQKQPKSECGIERLRPKGPL